MYVSFMLHLYKIFHARRKKRVYTSNQGWHLSTVNTKAQHLQTEAAYANTTACFERW